MVLRTAVFSSGMWPTRKAPALQAVSCGSVTRHLHHFHWELSRLGDCKSAVKKRAGRRPVEHYHQLPPFIPPTPWVPKPKSSRRTVVNRVINECESRRDRHGSIFNHNLGHEEDSQSAPLGTARHPERNRGARPLFPPRNSAAESVTSNHMVAGAIPAGVNLAAVRSTSQVSK